MKIINKLSPFKKMVITIGELPSAFLESMTYYEALEWFCHYLSETVIPTINGNAEAVEELQTLFIQLKNYVDNYFDSVDFQELVNNKLDAMAQDGTLENLLSQLMNKTNGSLVLNLHYRDASEFIPGITEESASVPIRGYIQGMTTTPTSIIYARQCAGSYQKNNKVYLTEVSKSTGQTLKESLLELNHANAIAYNQEDGKVYVACNSKYNSEGNLIADNRIAIVDYATFTLDEYVDPPTEITDTHRVRSISYDNVNGVLALADEYDVFIMKDAMLEEVETHITLDLRYTAQNHNDIMNHNTIQNVVVFNNKIYVSRYFATGVSVFDMSGKLLKNYYDFDIDAPVDIQELESIAVENNGDLYIASLQTYTAGAENYIMYDATIYKTNLIYNGFKNYDYINTESARVQFYVDSATTNHLQIGTQAYPFKSINQASMATQFLEKDTSCVFNLVGSNKNYGVLALKNNANVIITGNNNKLYGMLVQGQNLFVNNITFNLDVPINIQSGTYQSNIAITSHGNVTLSNCNFYNNSEEKRDYCIYIADADVYFSTVKFKNFTNAIASNKFTNMYFYSISVDNVDYYFYVISTSNIFYNSNAILNRINPASPSFPGITNTFQFVSATFENNVLEFENKNIESTAGGRQLFLVDTRFNIESANYDVLLLINRTQYSTCTIIKADKSCKYDIDVKPVHTSLSGIWQFTYRALKTDVATGTITDISDSLNVSVNNVKSI